MTKCSLWVVLGGVVVALLVPLVAGCSSPGGCRTCRKEPGVPARASAANAVVAPSPPPGNPTTAPRPFGGQKNCPVTGEELGSMGKPVAVTVKGQTVYVCCRGCAAKAQADPDKTLAAVAAEWAR
ncbi:MAG: hypothetical protein C0467_23510 [Planctomycetaceae bacterium]|nr:hypothetical protein [Planctomycetaceae bacterium]